MAYLVLMRDDRYRPWSWEDDPDLGSVSLINEVTPENVGVLVPGRQRSLHAVVELELGVRVATSGRGLFVISMCDVESSGKCFLLS